MRTQKTIKLLGLLVALLAVALFASPAAKAAILYGATGGGNPGSLYILDPTTGAVITDVGALHDAGGNAYAITGLAFRPSDGTLFGSTSNVSPTGTGHLVIIDPTTAIVVDVGS